MQKYPETISTDVINEYISNVANGSIVATLVDRYGFDHDTAEDAVQTAFVEVLPRLSTIDNFWSYTFRVAKREYPKLLSNAESLQPLDETHLNTIADSSTNDALKAAIAAEREQLVDDAIARLSSETERQVLGLAREGLPTKAIARQLRISEEHVRVAKFRALKRLNKELKT